LHHQYLWAQLAADAQGVEVDAGKIQVGKGLGLRLVQHKETTPGAVEIFGGNFKTGLGQVVFNGCKYGGFVAVQVQRWIHKVYQCGRQIR